MRSLRAVPDYELAGGRIRAIKVSARTRTVDPLADQRARGAVNHRPRVIDLAPGHAHGQAVLVGVGNHDNTLRPRKICELGY